MTDHPWIIVLAVVGIAAIITAVVLYLVYRRSLARGAAMILANTGNVATRYKLHGEDLVGLRYTFSSDVRPIQMIRATKPTEKRPSTTKQKAASSHVSESTSKVKAGRKGLKSASRAASSVNKFARFLPSDMRKSVTSATSQVQRAEGKVQKVENTERRVEGVAGRATHAIPSSKTQSAATLTVPTETDFQPDQTAEAAITCDLGANARPRTGEPASGVLLNQFANACPSKADRVPHCVCCVGSFNR